jgi:hypothetical protein
VDYFYPNLIKNNHLEEDHSGIEARIHHNTRDQRKIQ